MKSIIHNNIHKLRFPPISNGQSHPHRHNRPTRNSHPAPGTQHRIPSNSQLSTLNSQLSTLNLNFLTTSFIILLSSFFLSSCVTNKKITYLQETDVKEMEYQTDSVVKSYPLQYKEYHLKPKDIISIRIGSLTPAEYNFVKEYETQLGLIRKLDQYEQKRETGISQRYTGIGVGIEQSGLGGIYLDRQNTGFILDREGMLELPKLGYVDFRGLTLEDAEEMLQDMLIEGKLFETPVVRIQLLNFHFTILGEVENEGRYTSFDPRTTIFDAIVFAGNLTEFADRGNIKVVRHSGQEAEIIYVNPLDESMLQARNYFLQPGDLIVVPPLPARYWRRYVIPDYQLALGIISATLSLALFIMAIK